MSDSISLIITFLPLFAILLLANGSVRAQARDVRTAALALPPAQSDETGDATIAAAAAAPEVSLPATKRDDSATLLKAAAYLTLASIYFIFILGAMALLAVGALGRLQPELLATNPLGMVDNPSLAAWGILLPAVIGLILLLPPVRRFCARFIPIDPASPVHAVALSMTMLVLINMLLTLGVGLSNITTMVTEAKDAGAPVTTYVAIWGQQLLMALLGFLGVGWLLRRSWRETLVRLGLVRPTLRQVMVGIGLAFAMVAVVLAIQAVASMLGFAADADVDKLTEELLGPLFSSPFGILTLGLAAALGEETLMRGAAQPRFGLILTSILFALLHSNYGITLSTVIVFMLGIVLGIVRIRANTTTSMVLHATYNMILGLMAFLSIDILQQFGK